MSSKRRRPKTYPHQLPDGRTVRVTIPLPPTDEQQFQDALPFHIQGTASPHKTIRRYSLKWWVLPLLVFSSNDIHMSIEQEG